VAWLAKLSEENSLVLAHRRDARRGLGGEPAPGFDAPRRLVRRPSPRFQDLAGPL